MVDPLLRKTLRDLLGQTLGWGIGIGLMLMLTVLLYPSIGSAYADVMEELPEGFHALFGEASLDTLGGYLSLEFFAYAPLVLGIFAIMAGSASLVGEESQGTLDMLLAQPVPRRRLVLAKLAGLVITMGLVTAIVIAFFWLSVAFTDAEFPAGRMMASFLLLWPFEAALAVASALLAMVFSGRIVSGMVLSVYLVASYVLESLSTMLSGLEAVRPLFITSYFQGVSAINGDISWGYVGGSIGILGLLVVATAVVLERRDIGTRSGLRLHFPLRRRSPRPA